MGKLYIRTSNESLEEWDKERIVNALIRETYLDRRTAEVISNEVEKQVIGLEVNILTSTLIRELVGAKLIELGLEKAHKMHMRLGVPLFDVEQIILQQGKNRTVFPLGPELSNLALASRIKREYALINVFSQEVSDAHLSGEIYLEGLEFIDRLYCAGVSPEYIKKFGLHLPEGALKAKPAKHPEALISQIVGFTDILRGHFFYSVEWDAVNVLLAPYTEGLSIAELKQLVQKLVFELSRQSMSLHVATLLNLYWRIPDDLASVSPIGSSRKSKTSHHTYGEYLVEAQRVLMAILEVLGEGESDGKIFTLPLPVVHITDDFFESAGASDFLGKFAEFLVDNGHGILVFDRGNRRRVFRAFTLPYKTLGNPKEHWLTRHAVIHSVVINLPRFGYIARGSDLHLFAKLTEMMELAAEAHMQKRVFIEKLLATGKEGPLGILMIKPDGKSFLRLEQADFIISLVGLNELVQIHRGRQLHEGNEAVTFGLEIIAHMQSMCERLSQRHHISFVLSGFPNQAVSSRLARLDLRYYSPDSGHIVKGDLGSGKVYYTDAVFMNPQGTYDLLDRIKIEGQFARYLHGGSVSWIPVKGHFSHKKALVDFIMAVFRDTENLQLYFTPDASASLFHFLP
jgi:ribonucleoside-triphosphate reductase (formate)